MKYLISNAWTAQVRKEANYVIWDYFLFDFKIAFIILGFQSFRHERLEKWQINPSLINAFFGVGFFSWFHDQWWWQDHWHKFFIFESKQHDHEFAFLSFEACLTKFNVSYLYFGLFTSYHSTTFQLWNFHVVVSIKFEGKWI